MKYFQASLIVMLAALNAGCVGWTVSDIGDHDESVVQTDRKKSVSIITSYLSYYTPVLDQRKKNDIEKKAIELLNKKELFSNVSVYDQEKNDADFNIAVQYTEEERLGKLSGTSVVFWLLGLPYYRGYIVDVYIEVMDSSGKIVKEYNYPRSWQHTMVSGPGGGALGGLFMWVGYKYGWSLRQEIVEKALTDTLSKMQQDHLL